MLSSRAACSCSAVAKGSPLYVQSIDKSCDQLGFAVIGAFHIGEYFYLSPVLINFSPVYSNKSNSGFFRRSHVHNEYRGVAG